MSHPENPEVTASSSSKRSLIQNLKTHWFMTIAALTILASIGWVVWIIFIPSSTIETDDAHVDVEYATISPKISGEVTALYVEDHQAVKAGQLLARIDARDYEAALAEAESNLAKAQAELKAAEMLVERQPTQIREAQAQVRKMQASIQQTQDNTARYQELQELGAESRLVTQQSKTTLAEQHADLDNNQEKVIDAEYQLKQYKIQVLASQATLKQARAALDKAKLNLSYTEIYAPIDGSIGQKSVHIGNYVSTGNPLMVIVPLDKIYIEANFREVELKNVQSGQPVKIHVDAYNIDLNGIVDSFSPSTGAFFSPISSSNATGNFTKIVQRLPLRIQLVQHQPNANLLRPGLSVVVSINTQK